MFRWIPFVFVRIVLFFCAGILLALYGPDFLTLSTGIIVMSGLGVFYLVLAFRPRRRKLMLGATAMLVMLVAGYLNVRLKDETGKPDHLLNLKDTIQHYSAVVIRPVQEKEKTWKLEVEVLNVKSRKGWAPAQGKVMLYIAKNELQSPFQYGDILFVKGSPRTVPAPPNPGEFNYQEFLSHRQICHQQFVRRKDVHYLRHDPPSRFQEYTVMARNWADGVLRRSIPGKREQALASALVLGVTDGLDHELLNAYGATGAMHVLSVSGLHVGIIYGLILLLFKPFQNIKSSKWVMAAVSLVILWIYAFVTGVSPSVLRAVTMFSFVAVGTAWNHKTNIYNILAASAFFLLIYDPHMIMSVGFQLSYLAVVGIVTFQPGLYKLWEPTHWLWDEIWKVAAVSIAAQLATFSLGLLYFHQFPNYFLLTNLFVIPGSFIVLVGGIVMLVLSPFQPVLNLLGWLMHGLIKILNTLVFAVEGMPFSLFDNIHINAVQCWMIVLMTAVIYGWIETKKIVWVKVLAACCILFSTAQWIHFATNISQDRLIVYAVPGHSAIDFITKGKTFFVADTALRNDHSAIKFHITPNRLQTGVTREVDRLPLIKTQTYCSLMTWKGRTILQIHDKDFNMPPGVQVDFVIVSNNAVQNLSQLVSKVAAHRIIFDSSNTFSATSKILVESTKMNMDVFSVLHRGAFNITL